jgi:hypothetical protein
MRPRQSLTLLTPHTRESPFSFPHLYVPPPYQFLRFLSFSCYADFQPSPYHGPYGKHSVAADAEDANMQMTEGKMEMAGDKME